LNDWFGWPVWNWTAAAGVLIGFAIGWFKFGCLHSWDRRADMDHLIDIGRNKRFYWKCRHCGRLRWETAW
jgi:hypothetical protein